MIYTLAEYNNKQRKERVQSRKTIINNMLKGFSSPLSNKDKLQKLIFGY